MQIYVKLASCCTITVNVTRQFAVKSLNNTNLKLDSLELLIFILFRLYAVKVGYWKNQSQGRKRGNSLNFIQNSPLQQVHLLLYSIAITTFHYRYINICLLNEDCLKTVFMLRKF